MNISILEDCLPHNYLIMTFTDNKAKLVKIYYYVCDIFKKELKYAL